MDDLESSQPTTSFWPKNFKIKKKRAVVTSSDDSDQETQIDFSKSKTKTKTGLGVVVKENFSHLDQFLQYCCNKTECNFKTKSPEDFEAHFKFNSRNFSNH